MVYLLLGVLGIGVRLYVPKKNLIIAAFGGIISMTIFNFFSSFISGSATVFLTALTGSIFSEIMAHIRKTPITIFLPLSIIPILPGKAVYDAINLALHQDTNQFLKNIVSVFYATLSIALAVIVVRTLNLILFKIINSFSKRS